MTTRARILLCLLALAVGALFYPPLVDALPFGLAFAVGIVLHEGPRTGEFLAWESTSLMREQVAVLSGQTLKAGSVVGRVNKGVGRATTPAVVGTGNGVMSGVFPGPDVRLGNYVVKLITVAANGGTFSVTNPVGQLLPNAVVGTPYRSSEINFSIADGGTDFVLDDTFTIVVDTTAAAVVGTGNGTISSITLGPDAKPGNYRFEIIAAITNGGQFKLTGPDGELVDTGFIVAGAGGTYVGANKRQVNFTVTEGSTDFALGDAFNITVFQTVNGGAVVAWDPAGVDGRDDAVGVLLAAVDASAGTQQGVIITRDAVVLKGLLQWAAGISAAQKDAAYAQLAARNVVVRDTVIP